MNTEVNHSILGNFLNGRYQIVRVLSVGTFGRTYIAEDTWLAGNPRYLVKHLKPKGNHPKEWQFSQRLFANEVEILEKLDNYNQIPRLLDCFDDDQGFYLVQDLIVGKPLTAELPMGRHFGRAWSEVQCAELLGEVLDILEFIHRQGVIHGDLKPSNLLRRSADGRLVLINFSRAYQHSKPPSERPVLSSLSIPSGTIRPLGYIPPEQFNGHPYPNSDLYALGAIAIQSLTGLNPAQLSIDPNTSEISWQSHVSVSDPMACVLNHMVRHDFKNRYQCASDVRIVLNRLAIRSEELNMREEEFSEQFVSKSPSDLQPPSLPIDANSLEQCIHKVSRLENRNSPQPFEQNSSLIGESASSGVSEAALEELVEGRAGDYQSSSVIDKWFYAREIAAACWPKLPPLMTRVGAGMATSNALAISFGLYSLWYSAPSNPGLDLLMRATENYYAGNFDKAIALAQSVPADSSAYKDSLVAMQKWRQEWNIAATQFKAVEQAFKEERWRDVLEEARKTPDIPIWQQKIQPFLDRAIPELDREAQQTLQQAYQRASQKDFTAALALIEQIPPETPTGTSIQPKLVEYRQKQQIKAESLLQKAYQQAGARDFKSALRYLSQIPEDTPAYEIAQVKRAEYSQKQHFTEEANRQAMLASNFPKEELKIDQVSQRSKSSKASRTLNPGNHLREVAPQPVRATSVRRTAIAH